MRCASIRVFPLPSLIAFRPESVIGPTVKLAYVDQTRDTLDPEKTIWEEISGGHDMIEMVGREIPSRAYVGKFNFKGGDQQQLTDDLLEQLMQDQWALAERDLEGGDEKLVFSSARK